MKPQEKPFNAFPCVASSWRAHTIKRDSSSFKRLRSDRNIMTFLNFDRTGTLHDRTFQEKGGKVYPIINHQLKS